VAGYSVEDPALVRAVLGEAFHHAGPALVEASVDPNEPPLPGKITTDQAWKFTEALMKGERGGWEIFKTVLEDKVRELI
jgi:pyruvate dehydrogenase (quinone)